MSAYRPRSTLPTRKLLPLSLAVAMCGAWSSAQIQSWTVGVNWYLSANLKLATNYLHSRFDAAPGGAKLPDEKVLFSRLQVSF